MPNLKSKLDGFLKSLNYVKDQLKKDSTDDKIKAKLKAEMDRRNFGEADATRHIVDRDRGTKQPKKPEPLLQSELVKALADAGFTESALLLKNWGEMDKNAEDIAEQMGKSNYGPKDLDLYDTTANQKRKETRTGEEVEAAGKNKGVRQYTSAAQGTAKEQATNQAKVDAVKSKKQPIKVYTPEELKTFADARGEKVSKEEEKTIDYKKINQINKPVSEEKAPAIDYSGKEPKMRNEWKGKEVKPSTARVEAKQQKKNAIISDAVKQGKVIDDRSKPGTKTVPKSIARELPAQPSEPVKTAQETISERRGK